MSDDCPECLYPIADHDAPTVDDPGCPRALLRMGPTDAEIEAEREWRRLQRRGRR